MKKTLYSTVTEIQYSKKKKNDTTRSNVVSLFFLNFNKSH